MKASKDAGFTHFAAETFSVDIREGMADGAPDMRGAVYLFDPFFADLVRQAKALRFILVPYEQRPDQELQGGTQEAKHLAREAAQADHLANVLQSDPTARIFVYAGGSHIQKSVGYSGRRWMAGLLTERTGFGSCPMEWCSRIS